MATTLDNQQPWVPYEPTKDCSQGFCSIYCPQWCYIIFPPPPPFGLPDGDPSSGTAFSPLIIAIIGILASAFLLVSYYTILSKYCRRQLSHPPPPGGNPDDDDDPGQSRRHEAGGWHVAPSSNGLDEALINKITIYRYKRGDRMINGTDCSVCLGEFREEESLRLLPKCTHAFHLHCIDTWLKSHSNCPICRANIVSTETPVLLQLPAPPPPPLEPENHHPPIGEAGRSDEMVVAIEDLERGSEEEGDLEIAFDELKDSSPALCDPLALEQSYDSIEIRDGGGGGGDQSIRRSFSMDSSHRGRVSIADVLRISMEDELLVAKDRGLLAVSGSSRRCGGEYSKESSRSRGLHCVTSPVPMKRSFSSGRFCFTGNGRGRNPVLPM